MKRFFLAIGIVLFSFLLSNTGVLASGNIVDKSYTFEVSDTFGGASNDSPSQNWETNLQNFIDHKVRFATIALTIISTIMVVIGGIWMISSGGNSERSEKGKKIIGGAIIGVILGLLSYMIIVLLGNILN